MSWLHLHCNGSCLLHKLCRVGIPIGITMIYSGQCLLWMTCTGHHWLIALWTMIGANYWSMTASGMESLYCDLGATPCR